MDLGELFVIDSGEQEQSFIVAAKVKSFVLQCADLQEKKEWMSAFAACFAEMAKTVLYGKGRVLLHKENRITNVSLWMVREGEMVRETYLMPDLGEKTYGFIDFHDLRLIVDPQVSWVGKD